MKNVLKRESFVINTSKKIAFYGWGKWQRFYNNKIEKVSEEENPIINYKMVLGIKRIEIANLSSLCRDFHNIFRIDKYQLLKYTNDILPFIKYLRTSEIVMILHHYSYINYNNVQFYDIIWNIIINRLYDIDCKELALIIYSMGKIKYINIEMIAFFEKEIKKWLTKFSGRDCSLILKGMKNLNYTNEDIYSTIYQRILHISDDLNILDICIILNTHSKCKNINLHLFEMLLNKSLTFYSIINEQCIGSILWSVSNADIKAEKYFALLALKLRLLMREKLLKEGKIIEESFPSLEEKDTDSFNRRVEKEGNTQQGKSHITHHWHGNTDANKHCKLNGDTKNQCEKNKKSMERNNISDEINHNDDRIKKNIHSSENFSEDIFENDLNHPENEKDNGHNSCDMDNLNFPLNSNNMCKYENVIPSIIYAFGKQRTYLKHNINIDKNLYNHIVSSYQVENSINASPLETVYVFDTSRRIIREKNIFNTNVGGNWSGVTGSATRATTYSVTDDDSDRNANGGVYPSRSGIKPRRNHSRRYYQDVIYIINNYLTYFLHKVHYNDLKNVLFGMAKIEMSVNRKLFNDIFELIITYVRQNMYKNYEIINLARSVSLLPHVKPAIWMCILECYKNNFLSITSVKNNCYLFYIFSFVKKTLHNCNFDIDLIEQINKKPLTINRDDVIHLIRGLINLGYYHNELVNNISKYIEKNYNSFNLIDIVYILKYYTSMNLRNTQIFSVFAITIKKNYTRCNYSIISTIASFYLQVSRHSGTGAT
ncbi:hypothetical protein, conserved [Plasmodium ovale wallikeri]|uniref:Uncharacterized protein n=1 Tax=Plasmodium ovale wallikeri TaxID=864142 RepID=A0A1A8YRD7_PLAOA|nr:hypothetical protein, conserved [Plasmodium ovale wallikeri]SBT34558.1 hypothetical protein, conserved [Plasmodium ovale wallikeri]